MYSFNIWFVIVWRRDLYKPWYKVFHGLTLSNSMHSGVYVFHVDLETKFYMVENYTIMGFVNIIGGQGGDINVHGDLCHPSLGLGSCVGLGHSHPRFLCSGHAWCKWN